MKLNLQPGPFNLPTALALAGCAQAAYDAPTIQTPLAHARVDEFEDCIVVAFRGTANARDLITDARCFRAELADGVQIHGGFYDAWLDGMFLVISAIAATLPAGYEIGRPIWFTGHSLGGALATIAAARTRFPVAGLYTFGEPRSGNAAFARACDVKCGPVHYRVEDRFDVITRLPGVLAGYRHSGQLIHLPESGRWQENPVFLSKLWTDCLAVWSARRAGLAGELQLADELLEDHKLSHYVARLQEMQEYERRRLQLGIAA